MIFEDGKDKAKLCINSLPKVYYIEFLSLLLWLHSFSDWLFISNEFDTFAKDMESSLARSYIHDHVHRFQLIAKHSL